MRLENSWVQKGLSELAIVSYKGCEHAAFFIDIDVEKSVFEVQRAEYMGILQTV